MADRIQFPSMYGRYTAQHRLGLRLSLEHSGMNLDCGHGIVDISLVENIVLSPCFELFDLVSGFEVGFSTR